MEKKRFKFNILDLLIVCALAVCILGAFLRGGAEKADEKLEIKTAVITFALNNVQAASAQCFSDGDRVYNNTLGCEMGRIIGESITTTPAVTYIADNGRIYKTTSATGRIDIAGKIECEGLWSDSGFLIGGTQYIAPGISTEIYLPGISASIQIIDIK